MLRQLLLAGLPNEPQIGHAGTEAILLDVIDDPRGSLPRDGLPNLLGQLAIVLELGWTGHMTHGT